MEGFVAQKGLWNLVGEQVLQDSGALSEEEGDVIRAYKAMHEEVFLSSWLREEGEVKEERLMEMYKEIEEETSNNKTREEGKEENDTMSAKEDVSVRFLRRPLVFLVKAKIGRVVMVYLEKIRWRSLMTCLIVILRLGRMGARCLMSTVVPVSPSSVVTECSGDVSWDSAWEFVEPHSSSFSKKRAYVRTVSQEEMRYESSPVKKSSSAVLKKDDATAKLAPMDSREAVANRGGGPDLECA